MQPTLTTLGISVTTETPETTCGIPLTTSSSSETPETACGIPVTTSNILETNSVTSGALEMTSGTSLTPETPFSTILAQQYHLICPICNEKFSEQLIIKHFEESHQINMTTFEKTFLNMTEFKNWKIEYEKDVTAFYARYTPIRERKGYFSYQIKIMSWTDNI